MIIAITGGTGFIGRHLIARHIARGDQVRYLTRKKSTVITGASAYIADLCTPSEVLQQFVHNVDVLYHCAAELNDETKMYNTNVLGTANLLAAANGQVKRWVQLSSTGVYGIRPENDVDENSLMNPGNAYEQSKTEADNRVFAAINQQAIEFVVLRPSNVYGVDMPNQSLFQLIKMIDRGWFFFIGSKGAIANYIHIENVVNALILCATSNLPANGRIYIVSDYRTLEDFVGLIANALVKQTPQKRLPESFVRLITRVFGKLPKFPLTSSRVNALTYRHIYKTTRIEAELDFKTTVSMEAGITELVTHVKD